MISIERGLFVTGSGTGVGKTIVSAILAEALDADYWKPVQAGMDGGTDTQRVAALLSRGAQRVHEEAYRLSAPLSPHAAARIDGLEIRLEKIVLPRTARPLVVEGAGGVMAPLNTEHLMIDLIAHLALPAVVVIQNYLGSINHALLTLEALRTRGLPVLGLVFNGQSNPESEQFIVNYSRRACLARIEREASWSGYTIARYVNLFGPSLCCTTGQRPGDVVLEPRV